MTFKKILSPIDFSAGSRQAMRVAVRLAKEANAELALVHAWYLPPTGFAGDYTFAPEEVVFVHVRAVGDALVRHAEL